MNQITPLLIYKTRAELSKKIYGTYDFCQGLWLNEAKILVTELLEGNTETLLTESGEGIDRSDIS